MCVAIVLKKLIWRLIMLN